MDGCGIEQAFCRLAQDDEIDIGRARIGQALGRVGICPDRANAGIKAIAIAQPQMWRYLGPVGVANGRQADGAKENRIGRTGCLLAIGLDVASGLHEMCCAGLDGAQLQWWQSGNFECPSGNLQRGSGHVHADAVACNDGNLEMFLWQGVDSGTA